ncbi:YdcF family protein [Herbaspirillum rubrisubalbicans]|uniref:YdcF family protein n=1 Tax=Herbaspirillum rubrisubalbicans Os34 TaxID=1235827 RepID=A0A6M3ZM90_9BURK|nr:YdcF family protein [Herbaspirillum rubrisubalbicans]QJP99625.1 YdcF family protein [Herbaspirillum rubrisubalbicans Os34]
MKRLITIATCLLLIGLTGLLGIVLTGLHDEVQVSDVGIVLGSKVMPDGTPSERLRARLDKAAELYRQGMFKHIIVSGGTGKEGFNEALAMAAYLSDRQSITRSAILLDEQGNTTKATAVNSAAIMQAHGFRSALVVTQFFHIPRSRYALRSAGIDTVYWAHANYFDARDLYSLARETVALPAYWLGVR